MQTLTPYEHAKSWLKPATQMSTRQSFWSGMKAGADGNMLGLPFVAYEMGTAQRGEMLAMATGRVTGLCTYPVTAGLTLAMLSAIPGVNVVAYPIVAAILAQFPNSYLENKIISGVRTLNDTGRRIRRLEVGGDFEDSESAFAARQRSLRELTGTMQTSRRYLGQEALFMHR